MGACIRLVLGAARHIVALGVAAALAAYAIDLWFVSFLGKPIVFALAVASGLFVAAGVLRLARWDLTHDAHSALAGAALLVMGALCLPLGGFARLVTTAEGSLIGPAIRCVATFTAIALIVRALHATDASRHHNPARLLPRVFGVVGLVFLLLLVLQQVVPHLVTAHLMMTVLVTAALAVSWFGLAVHAAMHAGVFPWARRAAPLYLGMGLAETMRGLDLGLASVWTLAGVLLCATVALLAVRGALLDLDAAVRAERDHLSDLTAALDRASGEAGELTAWREQLTHDAQNACAGLRAAMEILERYDGRVDARVTERLRLSAIQEIGHIEHLLTRSSNQPCLPFDVTEVVRAVADAARTLGADVTVHGDRVRGTGRAADLAAVLKNILVNAQTHAPGSRVDIRVTTDRDSVTIACSDDGPGLHDRDTAHVFERGYRRSASPGSGLGLYAARELIREQGGDLRLGPARPGATFLITVPAVPARVGSRDVVRVPDQRAFQDRTAQLTAERPR